MGAIGASLAEVNHSGGSGVYKRLRLPWRWEGGRWVAQTPAGALLTASRPRSGRWWVGKVDPPPGLWEVAGAVSPEAGNADLAKEWCEAIARSRGYDC